jgi:hypothetical protein
VGLRRGNKKGLAGALTLFFDTINVCLFVFMIYFRFSDCLCDAVVVSFVLKPIVRTRKAANSDRSPFNPRAIVWFSLVM